MRVDANANFHCGKSISSLLSQLPKFKTTRDDGCLTCTGETTMVQTTTGFHKHEHALMFAQHGQLHVAVSVLMIH